MRVQIAFLATLTLLPATLLAGRAGERLEGNTLHFSPKFEFVNASLQITGPEDFSSEEEFAAGVPIAVDLGDYLADGSYKYRLRLDPIDTDQRPAYVSSVFFVEDGLAVSRESQRSKIGGIKERLGRQQAEESRIARTRRERSEKYPFEPRSRRGRPEKSQNAGFPYLYPYSTFGYGMCIGDSCPDLAYIPPPEGTRGVPAIANENYAGIYFSTRALDPPDPPVAGSFYSDWFAGAVDAYFVFVSEYNFGYPLVMDPFAGNVGLFGNDNSSCIACGSGDSGYSYGFPASMYIARGDGSASILVSNEGAGARRQMLVLENDGPPEIVLKDTSRGVSWKLDTRRDDFEINNGGTGQTEFLLSADGDMSIMGTLTQGSSRALKENFTPVDGERMLEEVLSLPLLSWNYKKRAPEDRHVGPMAEDFYAAFGLGESDRSLAPSDAAGVALAAIQGLHAKLEARDQEILLLRQQLKEVDAREQLLLLRQELKELSARFEEVNLLRTGGLDREQEAPQGISGEP